MTEIFKDHFSARAAQYAHFRPVYPESLADYLAGVAPGHALALDSACGTGQLAVLLAAHFARVCASDASAAQIENATAHPNITYRVARAEVSGLEAGSVDLATVAQGAHWLDLDAFFAEMRRVLRARGVLALISYGITRMDGDAGAVLAQFYRDLGPFWPQERAHVESGYQMLPFPFDEFAAPPLTMDAKWTAAQLIGYVGTWSAVKALDGAKGRAPFEDFACRLTAAWGDDPAQLREIRWPLSLRIGYV